MVWSQNYLNNAIRILYPWLPGEVLSESLRLSVTFSGILWVGWCHTRPRLSHFSRVRADSVQPHRRQPTRLPRPWDSPGKNTGVGCHFLLQCRKVKSESEVAQSFPTLSEAMDCSLPGSSVPGIFQARLLEWVVHVFATAKSLQSCPPLCTPIDGSPPGSPVPGIFSRQEHWSGLPFPSPMQKSEKWKWSHSVMSDPQRPYGLQPSRLLCPWDFPGKSTGVGCHCLLRPNTESW